MGTQRELRLAPADWDLAVADGEGPQIVVGGPGTGKTEFLVRRAIHLVAEAGVAASDLLILGFGRRGTADIDDRLRAALHGSIRRVPVATFHSLAARIVERHAVAAGWSRPPQVLTGPEQVDLVRRLLAVDDARRWSPAYRGLLSSPTFAREVADFILRAREQVLTAGEIAARCGERDDWRGLAGFIAAYDAALRSEARIDYGTLLGEAVRIVESRAGSAGSPTVDPHYVLVDEYQDTTAAQVRLLEAIAGPRGNLTVAGDPYQSIYSFRGTDLNNVGNFTGRFPGTRRRPAKRIVLTTSFRTPRAILDAAVRVTSRELPGAAGPVVPAPGNGRVDVFTFDQETAEAEWIAAEMHRLHLEGRVPYERVGIFVRSRRRFLSELLRALDRRGIPYDTPEARLVDRSAVRFVLDLVAAAVSAGGPAETAKAVRRILLGSMYELPLGRLRRLETARLASEGGSWPQAIRDTVPEARALAALLEAPEWANRAPAALGLWHVWQELAATERLATDPERSDERAAWHSLSQVLRRWNERNPGATLTDYLRLTEEEEFEARPLLSYRKSGRGAPTITTLHQCKGLEFDVVFIADAVEGVFPDLRSRDSLLGVRYLLAHVPGDAAEYRAYRLQEERRLAYTAMSRATRRVIWTATSTGFEEGRGIPSRFLALVAGTATVAAAASTPPEQTEPVTPREAEGLLRRALHDPAVAPPRRLAALTVLAERRDERMRDPLRFAGMRRRGPDHGVVAGPLTLSPSHAEAYEACPRRYVLERRLRVGGGTSAYLEFGSLLHRVLEQTEGAALQAGRARGSFSDAAARFDELFDAAAFGGAPFADAWHRRGIDSLRHLYEHWPSAGAVVAVEHPLEIELGGIAWRGRADRIEADNEGLGIVDYKTSRSPATIAASSESIQLGFYILAAAGDEALEQHGRPARAEMWFPAAGGQRVVRRALDIKKVLDIAERLRAAAIGIEKEDWAPAPGPQCERCPQRPVCPAWREGREAYV